MRRADAPAARSAPRGLALRTREPVPARRDPRADRFTTDLGRTSSGAASRRRDSRASGTSRRRGPRGWCRGGARAGRGPGRRGGPGRGRPSSPEISPGPEVADGAVAAGEDGVARHVGVLGADVGAGERRRSGRSRPAAASSRAPLRTRRAARSASGRRRRAPTRCSTSGILPSKEPMNEVHIGQGRLRSGPNM